MSFRCSVCGYIYEDSSCLMGMNALSVTRSANLKNIPIQNRNCLNLMVPQKSWI